MLRPLVDPLTYRRARHLLLGAVLLLPYLALAWLFATSAMTGGMDPLVWGLLIPAAALGVGVALAPGVRALEVTAARTLLGVRLPDLPDTWAGRRRGALWLVVNMVAGGSVALLILFALPVAVGFLAVPFRQFPPLPTGSAAAWTPPVAVFIVAATLYVLAGLGALLARGGTAVPRSHPLRAARSRTRRDPCHGRTPWPNATAWPASCTIRWGTR